MLFLHVEKLCYFYTWKSCVISTRGKVVLFLHVEKLCYFYTWKYCVICTYGKVVLFVHMCYFYEWKKSCYFYIWKNHVISTYGKIMLFLHMEKSCYFHIWKSRVISTHGKVESINIHWRLLDDSAGKKSNNFEHNELAGNSFLVMTRSIRLICHVLPNCQFKKWRWPRTTHLSVCNK